MTYAAVKAGSEGTDGYRICSRCIMDTSDPEIRFDHDGYCNHCAGATRRMAKELLPLPEREQALQELIKRIKAEGKGKEYDCIIGVSGGVDSTSVAFEVKRRGLRPLAVHLDNGWDSELAVDNISKTLQTLDIELLTYVVDWEEFKDLQMSFIRAGVANAETPTDHAITALLFKTAASQRTRFILSGSNLVTEAIMPPAWGHFNQDLRHLKALHHRFGHVPLKTMPTIGLHQYVQYVFVRGVRQIPFLNYVDYRRAEKKRQLERSIGWRDYGGKHYESVWTRFFQGYYLPTRFGYDKRRAHLSTLICSGQTTRSAALTVMETPPYGDLALLQEDMAYVIKKFGLSAEQFDALLASPVKQATDYPSHDFMFRRMERYKNRFRKIATTP